MQLEELHNIARLLDSHTMISYITRLHDNIIMLRLDTTNYCFDLNKGNPQIYILENPLKNKNYIAPFDNVLHKYFYKSHLQSCKLDGMNKILIIESETEIEIEFPRIFYFGYSLTDEEGTSYDLWENDHGFLAAKVSGGTYTLEYTGSLPYKICLYISLGTLLSIFAYFGIKLSKKVIYEKKKI